MVLHRAAGAVSTSSRCIQAGDLVIVYERFDSMKSVYVKPGESYGNRYGNFKVKVGSLSCVLFSKTAARGKFDSSCTLAGLGWDTIWQSCRSNWTWCHRLGVFAGTNAGVVDCCATPQDPNSLCSGYQHDMHIPGAQARLCRYHKSLFAFITDCCSSTRRRFF